MRRFLFLSALLITGCNRDPDWSAKAAVRDLLVSPDSAKFDNLRPCGGDGSIIGEVSSRGSDGKWVGRTRFVYVPGTGAMLQSSDERAFNTMTEPCASSRPAPIAQTKESETLRSLGIDEAEYRRVMDKPVR